MIGNILFGEMIGNILLGETAVISSLMSDDNQAIYAPG
jgi:hypothetical protein